MDLRFARGEEQLDLKNPEFSNAVADVASAIRGVPKDELASEEVKQHRRTVRTAWGGAALVGLLSVAATVFAIQSATNAERAEAEAVRANQEAARANQEADRAEAIAEAEAEAREAAERETAVARARELAASAIDAATDDSQLALLLAVEAIDQLPDGVPIGPALENGLRTAMDSDTLLDRYDERQVSGPTWMDVSRDGSLIVLSLLPSRTLEVVDADTFEPRWSYSEDTQEGFNWVAFSSEGTYVALSTVDPRYTQITGFVEDEPADAPRSRILIFESKTGELIRTINLPGACAAHLLSGSWREDLNLFGFGFVGCGPEEFTGTVRFVETSTWTTVHEQPASDFAHATFADDGELVAVFSGFNSETDSVLLDSSTWEPIRPLGYPFGDLSPDGTAVAGLAFGDFFGVSLEDALTGEKIDKLVLETFAWNARFSSDGGRLVVADFGDTVHVFDPWSGLKETEMRTGPSDSHVLVGNDLITMGEGVLSRWDASGQGRGDLDTVPLNLWVNGNSIWNVQDTLVAHVTDINTGEWWLYPVEAETGQLKDPIPATDAGGLVPLPGNRMLIQRVREDGDFTELGPFEVLDLATGDTTVIAGCWMEIEAADDHEPCPDGNPNPSGEFSLVGSKDGSEILIFDSFEPEEVPRDTYAYIWDAEAFEEKERINLGDLDAFGNQLRYSAATDKYLILHNRRTSGIKVFDRESGEYVPFDQGNVEPDKLEHDRVGNRIWMTAKGFTVWVLDLDDLSLRQVSDPAPGAVRALAPSPTGDRVAVGSTEGTLRIWSEEGDLLHVVPLVNPSDAWWIDDEHLVVGTANGPWTVITLDPMELVEIARGRIAREFTPTECDFYDLDC